MSNKKQDEIRMNPAALHAALEGDLENALIAATPGGIEAQEARGQVDFVASETLPRKCNGGTRQQLERLGIQFGENADDLFVNCALPEGWRKGPTDHSMWSDLLDKQGRKRGSIFYKAAFYDRDAFMSLQNRYKVSVDPVDGWSDPEYKTKEWRCYVRDFDGSEVWTSVRLRPEPPLKPREKWLEWNAEKDALFEAGRTYLDENFPNWREPLMYW